MCGVKLPIHYTHQKSLATLQPVEQRGTSIFWNGHIIANTACIHFKFGTVNNRYLPNSKPMKLRKTLSRNLLCNPLYNVDILIKNRFWSSNYTPFRFKMHLEPAELVFECLYQSTQILAIVLEFTCALIYVTYEGLNNRIDFICLTW